jgi:hypothetical protein
MIPASKPMNRRRPVWDFILLGGVERLTEWLMRGDAINDDDLSDLMALRQRLRAFDAALTAREKAAGVVLEDAE